MLLKMFNFAKMKSIFLFGVLLLLSLGCRQTDEGLQNIDQVLQIYISADGSDLLNSDVPGAYTNVNFNDVYGRLDNSPVSMVNKTDESGKHFLEYIAGARRVAVDSTAAVKTYESKIALALTKKQNDSVNTVTNDTMVIQYSSSSELFQLSRVYYNGVLKFTKSPGLPNNVYVQK